MNSQYRVPRFVVLLTSLCVSLTSASAWSEPAAKGSFFPIAATRDNGTPITPKWIYSVNGGKPVYLSESANGVLFEYQIKLNNLTVSVTPSTWLRTSRVSGAISGSAKAQGVSAKITGGFAHRLEEQLEQAGDGRILLSREMHVYSENSTIEGFTLQVRYDYTVQYTPALELFIARNDLDSLPVGTVHTEPQPIQVLASGVVCARADGQQQCESISETASFTPSWRILDHRDGLQVGTTRYANVVQVSEESLNLTPQTSFFSAQTFFSGSITPLTAQTGHWLAKGVGLIRHSVPMLNRDLPLSLKSSPFTVPKIKRIRPVAGEPAAFNVVGSDFGKPAGQVLVGTRSAVVNSWRKGLIRIILPPELSTGTYSLKVVRENGVESIPKSVTVR